MKKYFIFLLVIIAACSTSKKNISVEKSTKTELTLAKEKVPGITNKRLKLGKKIYIQDCSGCHALKDPYAYTATQWDPILKRMFVKAKVTDSTDKKLISDYVISKSK